MNHPLLQNKLHCVATKIIKLRKINNGTSQESMGAEAEKLESRQNQLNISIMKKNIFIVALFMLFSVISFSASAQNGNMEDVVYLKNGSVIHGTIIEQVPNESLKIKTKDGSVFVYKMADLDKITKEQIPNTTSNIGNNYSANPYATIPTSSYKQIKMNYNYKMYVPHPSDPYNPTVSGICSWLIPGTGQMICGETGRGLGFLGGYLGCSALMGIGSGIISNAYYYDDSAIVTGSIFVLLGALGCVTVDIWSIVDAVHVAKVKNMYVGDMRSKTSSLNIELSPYIDQISMNNEVVRPIGLTMRVKL